MVGEFLMVGSQENVRDTLTDALGRIQPVCLRQWAGFGFWELWFENRVAVCQFLK